MSDDPLREWAERAAKMRFGSHVVLKEDTVVGASGVPGKYVWLEFPDGSSKLLGSGRTWPDAVTEAVKHNTDIPQPAPDTTPAPPPVGEEFIEEFCQAMRGRDLPTEFLLWYGERSDRDPEKFPRALDRKGWLEWFGSFITGYEEE